MGMVAEIMFPPARPTRAFVGTARSVGLAGPAVALALIVLAGISASLAFVIESSATPAPGGTAHSPSARRKLVVPPLPAVWASARKTCLWGGSSSYVTAACAVLNTC